MFPLSISSSIVVLITGFLLGTFVGYPAFINYTQNHHTGVSSYVSSGDKTELVTVSKMTGVTSYERYAINFPSGDESITIDSGYVKTVWGGALTAIEFSGECQCVNEIVTTEMKDNTYHRWKLYSDGEVMFKTNGHKVFEPYEKHRKVFEDALMVRAKFKAKYGPLVDVAYKKHLEELVAEAKQKDEVTEEDGSNWLEKYK